MDMLLLTTPTQHRAENPCVELNAKRLKNRLQDIPVMDVQATVEYFERIIKPFNEIKLATSERLKLLEVLHESYEAILVDFDDLRLSMLPISASAKRKLSLDIMWLYLNLANGYKIIIKEYHEKGRGYREQELGLVLYRAMELIILALLYTYRAHVSPPPLAYLEIHQLFLFAFKSNLHEKKLKAVQGHSVRPSILTLYKQFLLVVISDPYRMSSRSIYEYYILLEQCAEKTVLTRVLPEPCDKYCYSINSHEDATPRHLKYDPADDYSGDFFVLNIANAFKQLQTQLVLHENRNDEFSAREKHHIKALLHYLDSSISRKEERVATNKSVFVWFGLDATRYFLDNPAHIDNAMSIEATEGIVVGDLADEEDESFPLFSWTIRNEGKRGYLLQGDKDITNGEPLLGEIAGVIENEGDAAKIGLVRWERIVSDSGLNVGLELITGTPHVVKFRREDEDKTFIGLNFLSDASPPKITALLVPRKAYQEGARISMNINDRLIRLAFGKAVYQTNFYVLCQPTS